MLPQYPLFNIRRLLKLLTGEPQLNERAIEDFEIWLSGEVLAAKGKVEHAEQKCKPVRSWEGVPRDATANLKSAKATYERLLKIQTEFNAMLKQEKEKNRLCIKMTR
jgi:hypothetical protein